MTTRRHRPATWQSRVWEFADTVPEVADAFDNYAKLIARVRWTPGVVLRPDDGPVPLLDLLARPEDFADAPPLPGLTDGVAATAVDLIARLSSPTGGQAGVKRELAWNLGLPGECWVAVWTDPDGVEICEVLSVDELRWDEGRSRWLIVNRPGERDGIPLPDDSALIRMWNPHPRWSALPWSRMRSALDDFEELSLLASGNHAVASARIANTGVLVYNSRALGGLGEEMDPARRSAPQPTDDPVFDKLAEAMMAAIGDPTSAGAVVPPTLGVDGDPSNVLHHLTFDRPLDGTVLERMDHLVRRIASALPVPVEHVLGLSDVNHWSAWQIEDTSYRVYLEPGVQLQTDGLTLAWFQPGLAEAFPTLPDETLDRLVIMGDPSGIIVRPNRVDDVREAYRDGAVAGRVYREAIAVAEDDAPTEDELAERVAFQSALRGPAPYSSTPPASGIPDSDVPSGGAAARTAAGIPAGRGPDGSTLARLGVELAAIDRSLLERLLQRTNAAVDDALRVAASRLRAKAQGTEVGKRLRGLAGDDVFAELRRSPKVLERLGVSDALDGSFDALGVDFDEWVESGQRRANAALVRAGRVTEDDFDDDPTERQTEHRDEGRAALLAAVGLLAWNRITSGPPDGPTVGEFDPKLHVSAAPIRDALARAGGAQVTTGPSGSLLEVTADGDTRPAGLLATGPDTVDTARSLLDVELAGYTWEVGDPAHPFEPHQVLAGVEFDGWEDDQLTNDEAWPEGPFYFPGDHGGCQCSFSIRFDELASS